MKDMQAMPAAGAEFSESQRAALLMLLTDDDPAVYQTIRGKILSSGPSAADWLRAHTLSGDPALRRRTREIVLHFDRQEADNRFLAFCLRHGEEFDLEQGAWLLAQTRYPEINVEAFQAVLDSCANSLRERLALASGPRPVLTALKRCLFEEMGFSGNEDHYYDPENSYLNRVLDRRTGNPISLCLVCLLLARRLKLPISGIGLPGHFICRYQSSVAELYFDPFNRGKLLSKAECVQIMLQGGAGAVEESLAPSSPRRMLLRICSNLHQCYVQLEMAAEMTRLQRYLVALGK